MWDEDAGTFLAVRRDNLEKCPRTRRRWWEGPPSLATRFPPTIGSWLPLLAGVPAPEQAARMAEVVARPEWCSAAGICTVGRGDPAFGPDRFWRGDTWANTTYLIVRGLADYGFQDLASEIADRTVANAMRNGLPERYHSDTGEPLGLRDYAFGCAVLSMLADGLTRTYRMEKRT
jgi:glycogen debranching enzyme